MSAFFSLALTALVKKEFLSVLKDRTSRMILVAPIILYIILFGYIASFNLERIPYAVCDLAKTELSSELIRRIEAGGIFQRVATLTNTAQVRRAVDETDALVVAVIAPDFSSRFYSGRSAPVQVVVDGRNSTTAQLAAGYLQTIVSDFSAEKSGVTAGVAMRLFYNPNNITQWFILPGLIVMLSMLQTVVLAALSVAREREQGTFEQLSVTPVTTGQILFAKAFVPMVVGLMQACLILAADLWWFRIPLAGSFAQILTILLIFIAAVVGLGLAISAYSKNMQQALLLVVVNLVPMVLLSGLFTPVANMAEWVQALTWLDPLRFALLAMRRVYLAGCTWGEMFVVLWPAAVVAGASLPLAYVFFRRKV